MVINKKLRFLSYISFEVRKRYVTISNSITILHITGEVIEFAFMIISLRLLR